MNKCRSSKYQMKTTPIEQISNRFQAYPKIRTNISTSVHQYTRIHLHCCFVQNDNVKRPNLRFCDEPQYQASTVSTGFILGQVARL